MGPTWQSVSPSIEGRIPTAPPGPRNDGRVHKVRLRAARPVVAPYRFATFDTRRTTGEQPGQARLSG